MTSRAPRGRWLPLALGIAVASVACGGTRKSLSKAERYLEDGRPGAATRAYEDVLEKKPGMPEALMGVALARIADGDPSQAIVPAQVAVEVRHPGARPVLARALIEAGRGSEAVAHVEAELAQTDDPSVALQVLLAEARLASGDRSGAVAAAEEALMAGGGGQAQALAAWLHARTGNCDRALMLGDRAMTGAQIGLGATADVAAAARSCGDPDRAASAGSAARTLAPGGPRDLQIVASRFLRGGDLEGGARRLAWVRATWPELGLVARDLGATWMRLKEDGRAEVELTQALSLAPFAVARGSGSVQVVNRSADGMDANQRRVALLELYQALGTVRTRLGTLESAAEALQQVAELEVNSVERWLAAARTWAAAGRARKGVPAMLEALERAPNDPTVQATAADVFARAGDVGRAIGHGRVAWDLDPSNVPLAIELANLYAGRGETREARRILETTKRQRPDPRIDAALQKLP